MQRLHDDHEPPRSALKDSARLFGLAAVLGAAVLGALALLSPSPAKASGTSSAALAVAGIAPAVGPAFSDSFTINCASAAATPIVPPSGASMMSYECINEATTMVAVGDSAITDPGTTRGAPVFCAQGGTCPTAAKAVWGGNLSQEFCRGDTDTTIFCRAMVATLTPP